MLRRVDRHEGIGTLELTGLKKIAVRYALDQYQEGTLASLRQISGQMSCVKQEDFYSVGLSSDPAILTFNDGRKLRLLITRLNADSFAVRATGGFF